jgi:chaperonin GroEL
MEGIVAGGGVALLNASRLIKPESAGEIILLKAIQAPYHTILENAGYDDKPTAEERSNMYPGANTPWVGVGIDVTCGCYRDMIENGIIDPVLVTKAALKNAISVALTITSADCIISNVRSLESN